MERELLAQYEREQDERFIPPTPNSVKRAAKLYFEKETEEVIDEY